MFKILKSNWFWLFWATCLICFSITLFASWVLMVGIWFSLFFIFRLTKLEAKLPESAHKLFLSVVLIYPLAETTVKWALSQNIIEYWMRAKDGIVDYYKFSQFYPDTIYDMMVNILGAALGFVLLKVCLPNNSQT